MAKLQIIVGSTRPGRVGDAVAQWVYAEAKKRDDFEVEIVDVADFKLPLLDEPMPPSTGHPYKNEHTQKWSDKIKEADGYIFVTAEYNHSIPGALKNAIDYLYNEWNNKAAGFVGYGSAGGVRAIEQLRQVMGEVQVADVRTNVLLSLSQDFENYSVFKPRPMNGDVLNLLFDQVVAWAEALNSVRSKKELTLASLKSS
jgi:NAD(P)H-dependent FMN reductase